MNWGSIYLVVKDFDKSLDFYEKVLDMKVLFVNLPAPDFFFFEQIKRRYRIN